jgi:hypothetical protein
VKKRLKEMSNPDVADTNGHTILTRFFTEWCSKSKDKFIDLDAQSHRFTEAAALIVNSGASVDKPGPNGKRAIDLLMDAIKRAEKPLSPSIQDLFCKLAQASRDPSLQDADGLTVLHGAVSLVGKISESTFNKVLEHALSAGFDVALVDIEGCSILESVATDLRVNEFSVTVVEKLLRSSARPRLNQHICSERYLNKAVRHYWMSPSGKKLFKRVLAMGVSPASTVCALNSAAKQAKDHDEWLLDTLLESAGQPSAQKRKLLKKRKIDGRDGLGCTAFMTTPRHLLTDGREEAERLLAAGANPTLADDKGRTVLHHFFLELAKTKRSFRDGHAIRKFLVLLVDSGVDINHPDRTGATDLHIAVDVHEWIDVIIPSVEILVSTGANLAIQNQAGDTPLHRACKQLLDDQSNKQLPRLIKVLAQREAVTIINVDSRTPLGVLTGRGFTPQVAEAQAHLIRAGASIDRIEGRMPPLHDYLMMDKKYDGILPMKLIWKSMRSDPVALASTLLTFPEKFSNKQHSYSLDLVRERILDLNKIGRGLPFNEALGRTPDSCSSELLLLRDPGQMFWFVAEGLLAIDDLAAFFVRGPWPEGQQQLERLLEMFEDVSEASLVRAVQQIEDHVVREKRAQYLRDRGIKVPVSGAARAAP